MPTREEILSDIKGRLASLRGRAEDAGGADAENRHCQQRMA
jgi:hypothetical protein